MDDEKDKEIKRLHNQNNMLYERLNKSEKENRILRKCLIDLLEE